MKNKTPDPRRGDSIEATIFRARRAPLTREALQRALAPELGRWIRATCIWKARARIGDYRFGVFTIDVAPGIKVFVQFWSEPGEPVLWEVSSGAWSPPADAWLAGKRSERIAAFGFEIGGTADNFRREVTIRTPADAARVAATVADIMYAGFDYRGLQPVKARMHYDGRAEPALVYESFTPEDLTKIFARCRFFVEPRVDAPERPLLTARRRGITTTIACIGRVPDQRLYRAAVLTARVQGSAHEHTAATEFETTMVFDGGVTLDWVMRRIQEWDGATWACRQESRRPESPVLVPETGPQRVH